MRLARTINYKYLFIISTNTDSEHFKLVKCNIKLSYCSVGLRDHWILLKWFQRDAQILIQIAGGHFEEVTGYVTLLNSI